VLAQEVEGCSELVLARRAMVSSALTTGVFQRSACQAVRELRGKVSGWNGS